MKSKSMKEYRLKVSKEIARERGGRCLSEVYVNNATNMLWECKEKHRWKSNLNVIKNKGYWCNECRRLKKNNKNLQVAIDIAKSRGGKCLSSNPIKCLDYVDLVCHNGHYWKSTLTNIKNGRWCKQCANIIISEKRKSNNGLEIAKDIAKKRGGKCLSNEYKNNKHKLIFECRYGHKWRSNLNSLMSNNRWCPKCAGVQKLDGINIAHNIAAKKRGKCLSVRYVNTKEKMMWKCSKGHLWLASLNHIKNSDSWCPECSIDKREKTMLLRYGVDHPMKVRQIALKQAKSANNSYIIYHWKTKEELVCQGTWELKVIRYLNKNKVDFRWQPKIFKMPDGRTYRPDLYIIASNKWVEIKGYFRKDSREKWEWFKSIVLNSEIWNREKLKKLGVL